MKNPFLLLTAILFLITAKAQVKIGDNSTTINSNSILELESTNKGFVFPRVSVTSVTSSSPLSSSLLKGTVVYNTNTLVAGGLGQGLYLWDGSKWIFLTTSAQNLYWQLLGNNSTNSGTNFLGTTDNAGLSFRTNNIRRMFIDSLGSVAIGATSFDAVDPERLLVNYGTTTSHTLATFVGGINDYLQINLQNTSSGSNASSDYIATADNGTDSTNYVDLGINSSTYAPSIENFGGPNDAYLYSSSRNLLIGTDAVSSDIIFLLGGGRIKPNSVFRLVAPSGNVVVGKGEASNTPVGNILRGPNGSGTNIAGGSLTLQGGAATGTAAGGNVVVSGGLSVSGTAGSVVFNTANTERIRIDAGGNVGVGITNPSYPLDLLASSNPLRIQGLQSGSAGDNVLTVTPAGVVRSVTPATITGGYWSLTGNSGTSASTNFLGTTDNQSLVFKANNQLAGKIDLTSNNLSFGYQSANSSPSGTNNTFLGYQSGYASTSGLSNTGVGSIALNANTTGSNNAALGMGALGNNTTGSNNTSVGAGALRNSTTAASNVAVGASALRANTTGNGNTAVGTYTMQVNTTGYSNSAIGSGALGANTTGTGNTAAGNSSLGGNVLGINNTAVGNGAMQLNDQGNANTALGAFAMQNSNGSGGNTAIGYTTLSNISTGTNNTALGSSAGITNTTGTNNTLLGFQADVTVNNLTNATALGYNAQVSASNSLVLGNGANIGIGTSSPGYKLHVVAATNPLYLAGVQTTATFSSDSILTINKGVVKLAPYAALPTASGGGWALTGNSGTSAGTNFLGTTDNQSLVFKANSQQSGKIDLPLNNTSFGYLSANNITTGTNNTFLGYQTGTNTTSGLSNTGVGSNALKNTTGSDNTANGNNALTANTTGYRNTAVGSNTLLANTTGGENSANGALVLYSNTSGNQNTAAGNTALYSNTTGNSNTANGFQSLYNNTTGFYNTGFGYKSLYNNTTGTYNTALGYGADVATANLSNATAIGYNTVVSASNSLILGNGANVGIGTSTPNNKLEVNSGTGGASGLRLTQLPAGAVLFMSSNADVAQNNNNFYFDVTNYRLGITAGTSPNSTLQVGGSLSTAIVIKTANYTASASDYTILCNNTAAAITVFLPNASGITGRMYVIKKISSSFSVTIQASGSQTIDGVNTQILTSQYQKLVVQSDGSNWYIIN